MQPPGNLIYQLITLRPTLINNACSIIVHGNGATREAELCVDVAFGKLSEGVPVASIACVVVMGFCVEGCVKSSVLVLMTDVVACPSLTASDVF